MTFRAAASGLLLLACIGGLKSVRADVDYVQDIKPLLEEKCAYCHGASEQKAGFRADAGRLINQGGDSGAGLVPGKSGESLLIQAVTGKARFKQMPLEDDPLTPQQIQLLREWIDQGAKFPEDEPIAPAEHITTSHWSFQRVERPAVPDVSDPVVRNAIDAFILHKLRGAGLTPSGEAERRVLIRRVSLDLTGLLPTPEEVEAFVADPAPDAYEQLVDRLLASPHYGERWGRHWLDAARYADSNGFTIDGPRQMWLYRDWVIRAINDDMPFDQFTIEQLAGDMLSQPTVDQRIATGFHRNTLANEEGGTDDEQFRNEALVDRVNTTGAVWQGLTIGCCQCHDHKYDPLTQRDYYRVFAIFNNTADNNDANGQAPKISVPDPEQSARQAILQARLAGIRTHLRTREKELEQLRPQWESELRQMPVEPRWSVVTGQPTSAEGQTIESLGEGKFLVKGPWVDHDNYSLELPAQEQPITAIRLETLTHPDLPKLGPGTAGNGNFVLSEVELLDAEGRSLEWAAASADHSQDGYDVSGAIDHNHDTGWAINTKGEPANVPRTATFVLKKPVQGKGLKFVMLHQRVENNKYLIGSFRVSTTSAVDILTSHEVAQEIAELLATVEPERTPDQQKKLTELQRQQDKAWSDLKGQEKQVQDEQSQLNKEIPTSLVLEELPQPREAYIHIRGDFLSKGAAVTPGTPAALPAIPDCDRPTRADFAKWLVSRDNPLTARVTVNRIWQRLFGLGLVETENDFGLQGSAPSHPELLDWLAAEFMEGGWKVKELQRLIVTSATYRQSSDDREELRMKDPRNLLLGRQNRVRLEAEVVRDATLSASGLLSEKLYGPPVHPPQPAGIYVLTQNRKDWPDEKGEDRYRRSLYTYFWRSSPHPMFPTFDAPDATTTCTRRNRSNTPLQALTLANDRGFIELAQGLASRILQSGPDYDAGRIRYAGEVTLGRDLSSQEQERIQQLLEAARGYFGDHVEEAKSAAGIAEKSGSAPAESAAWVAVARVLANLDEFYTRE